MEVPVAQQYRLGIRLAHALMTVLLVALYLTGLRLAGISGEDAATIMRRPYPEADPSKIDTQAVTELEWLQEFVVGVRRIRSEMDIKPGKFLIN